ncbi:MAG: GIY-YIG nuclease family protein [Promethearchaeota archaeon]|jgi:hypothetical protein
MKKHIYLIQSTETGRYKIGVSKNPHKRIKQLQTGSSEELNLINSFESEYYNKIEKGLHSTYSHLSVIGEWFNLTLNEEVSFINKCEKIEGDIKILKELGNEFI